MKKQVFLRSLLGAFVGCFIGVVIIICISLAIGGGDMHVATPALLAQVGSEVGAFSLQMAAAMLIGAIGRAHPSFGKWSVGACSGRR